jgi:hypothetical protein
MAQQVLDQGIAPKKNRERLKATLTRYGFKWGDHEITRVVETPDGVVLWVQTKKKKLEIAITPSGLIRTALTDQDGATYPASIE